MRSSEGCYADVEFIFCVRGKPKMAQASSKTLNWRSFSRWQKQNLLVNTVLGSAVSKPLKTIENQFETKLKVMNTVIFTLYNATCELIEVRVLVSGDL